MRTRKVVAPALISSPFASIIASRILAPFKSVPFVLPLSITRHPLAPHSSAKCTPDICLSSGRANSARPSARPITTDRPVASRSVCPADGPALISRRTPIRGLFPMVEVIGESVQDIRELRIQLIDGLAGHHAKGELLNLFIARALAASGPFKDERQLADD